MLGLLMHQTLGKFKTVRFDKLAHQVSAHLTFAFVLGLRLAAVRTAGFFAAAVVRFFFVGFFFTVVVVAVVPDETRDECLTLWRTAFFGAASAAELSANDASSAITNIFIV